MTTIERSVNASNQNKSLMSNNNTQKIGKPMNKIMVWVLFIITFLITPSVVYAEKNIEVDPSKMTNLYTQVNVLAEYTSKKDGTNLYGTRFNIQYAYNPDNLFLIEVPFLYNDKTKKSGVADMRIRYFNVIKRDITEKLIAIAPFIDVSLPTGSFSDGLGSSSTSVTTGLVFGYTISPKISLFPGIGYTHITKPHTNKIANSNKHNSDGISLQTNLSYSLSKGAFFFFNPTVSILKSNGVWKDVWGGEFNFNYIVEPNKMKINAGYFPNFTNKSNTFRVGITMYF